MSRIEGNTNQIATRLHQHYDEYFVGTGAQTEFFLAHTISRVENVEATVNGVRQRVSSRGTAYDYKIRGLTPGYNGDQNAITFTVAPPAAQNVAIRVIST